MTNDIDGILKQRGSKYGPFSGHARFTQDVKSTIKKALMNNDAFLAMEWRDQVVVLESLEMIAHKMGRIVNGDPMYADSWQDISGYAHLVIDHIDKSEVPF